MSVTGKDGKSITKVQVQSGTASPQIGYKDLVFWHEASAGETTITLTSLNTPSGKTNPNPADLADAKLFRYQNNLTLESTLSGKLIGDEAYKISSNITITLDQPALEGEIFKGTLQATPIQIQGIDGKTQFSKGELAIGATDFAIGFSTSASKEEVLVFRNGFEQTRNTGNSSTVLDGNYYVVDSGSGFGNVIRFNTAPVGQSDNVTAVSVGAVISSPTDSAFDEIEKVQGQIDALVPTVAALAGVPETDFQANPNNVDLRQFGSRVVELEEPGVGGPKLATVNEPGAQRKNRVQTKTLSASVSSNGVVADLTFNNLVIGKWYEVKGKVDFILDLAVPDIDCNLNHQNGGNTVYRNEIVLNEANESNNDGLVQAVSYTFQAEGPTLTFTAGSISTGSRIVGDGTRFYTFMQLIERNDLVETTDFT